MFSDFLIDSVEILAPTTSFNGLSDKVTGWSVTQTVSGRIRPLSNRERYINEGEQSVSTHRVDLDGDNPISTKTRIRINGKTYQVNYSSPARTGSGVHHTELDVTAVTGI